jgi:hypothetical protein
MGIVARTGLERQWEQAQSHRRDPTSVNVSGGAHARQTLERKHVDQGQHGKKAPLNKKQQEAVYELCKREVQAGAPVCVRV